MKDLIFYDAFAAVSKLASEVSSDILVFISEFFFNNIDKRELIFSCKSFLSTIRSTNPHSWTYSARWKFSGKSSFTVAWITRRPANAIKQFGSAIIISPKLAKEAMIPPAVGSVKQTI